MAYFNMKNTGAALSLGGTDLSCLQTVEVTSSAPNTEVECSGSSSVTNITGIPRYSLTFTGALDDEDVTLMNAINVNDAGAIVLDPAGTATDTIHVTSTNGTVQDVTYSFPINGFSTYSGTILLDDLTYAANS